MHTTKFLVIEHFRNGDPVPVYARLAEKGRQLPDGLRYVASWVCEDLTTCWQIVECSEREILQAWMESWSDLVEFEVVAVIESEEAARRASSSGALRRDC